MHSDLPKVLHPVGGRPMLAHILETASALAPAQIHVVIGSGAELVREACTDFDVNWVILAERKGTGHAVAQAMPSSQTGFLEIARALSSLARITQAAPSALAQQS